MNDISAASNIFVGVLYADDSNLVNSLCSFDVPLRSNFDNDLLSNNITEELSKVHEWLQINKLFLNVKKKLNLLSSIIDKEIYLSIDPF